MAQARRASDECIFMLLGELVEHGRTEDLSLRPKNPKTEGRYGKPAKLLRLQFSQTGRAIWSQPDTTPRKAALLLCEHGITLVCCP